MSGTLPSNPSNVNLLKKIEKICRICLEQKAPLQNIFSLSLDTIIMECAAIQINANDGLPQMICKNCIIMAKQTIKFIAQCETNDKILRKMKNDSFTDIKISEDPLYIDPSEFSVENENEINVTKLEGNCELAENSNFNEIFRDDDGGSVKEVEVNSVEIVQDKNINNKSDVNGEFKKPLRKRKKKMVRRYNCVICRDYFRNQRDLSKHIDETHGERPFKCDICPRTFNYEALLKSHMKMHIGHKPFSCSVCDKRFVSKLSMKNHSWQHKSNEKRPFLCSLCGKTFINATILSNHKTNVHQKAGNHQCEHCSKSFSTQDSLKQHIRYHSERRKVVCTICGGLLSSSNALKGHMRTHNIVSENDRRYSCTLCSKKFFTSSLLKHHIFTHTGEKNYICTVCKRAFAQSSTLKTHMWIHKGGYPFQCDVCGQRFRRNNFLLDHKKKRHQEIPIALDDKK